MLRANAPKRLLSLIVLATLGSASIASAQSSWKLYDVRDLIGLLPPPPRVEPPAEKTPAAAAAAAAFMGLPTTPKPSQADPVDELMGRLCGALGAGCTPIFTGVYELEAEESEHAVLLSMLERVRELYAQRYDVEVVWYETSPDEAPQIGDPVTPTTPVHRQRLVATRRTPTNLVRLSRYAYVAGVEPVVATEAIGYSSQIGHVERGLRASILIGADRETETASSIRVRGDLRQVALGKMSGPVTGSNVSGTKPIAEGRSIEIELPEVSMRSIRSNIRIEYGKLTALAVVDGFGDGQSIVIAASVRRLGD